MTPMGSTAQSAMTSAFPARPEENGGRLPSRGSGSRRLRIHGVRPERCKVPLPAGEALAIRLGQTMTLKLLWSDLGDGKATMVIGMDVALPQRSGGNSASGVVILDLFGWPQTTLSGRSSQSRRSSKAAAPDR